MADEGMSLGTKALLAIGAVVVVGWGLPTLLDVAARHPRELKRAARATRSARDRALAAGQRAAHRTTKYLSSKF